MVGLSGLRLYQTYNLQFSGVDGRNFPKAICLQSKLLSGLWDKIAEPKFQLAITGT